MGAIGGQVPGAAISREMPPPFGAPREAPLDESGNFLPARWVWISSEFTHIGGDFCNSAIMKIFFSIQSEGSGHTVQAIGLKQILADEGHNVSLAISAKKAHGFSSFFSSEFNIHGYDGFDFIFKDGRLNLVKTTVHNLLKIGKITKSFIDLLRLIKEENPDMIVNFYDPLVGLTSLFFPDIKYVSIGHQYAMTHCSYPKVSGFATQKLFLKLLNWATAPKNQKIALSFYDNGEDNCCPPLLRRSSYECEDVSEDFVLVYLMNDGMLPQLINEAIKHPAISIECFTKLTKEFDLPKNLSVQNLNGDLFIKRMKRCRAVICSGGFETASEAMLMGKPLLMVPIKNHFEQISNCIDAEQQGRAAHWHKIDLALLPKIQSKNAEWFFQIKNRIEKLMDV